ncbi:MAG TPA: hypothetical protein PKC69_12600 [Chitinophagaceae bacterium]|nr:hypothetical protein [Chitinophagaceae bacterium]
MKDFKSLLLILLAAGLTGTWVYHLYDKNNYSKQRKEILVQDAAAIADAVRDSLSSIYTSTIRGLDEQLAFSSGRADSMQQKLDTRLLEISRLKKEIGGILNKTGTSAADIQSARQKISELQRRIEELRQQNVSMEEEKKQLGSLLDQISRNADSLQQNVVSLRDENNALKEKVNAASIFMASGLSLVAVNTQGSRESTTSTAKKADKFIVSFEVQNNLSDISNAEVHTIIIQPDGQVLQQPELNSSSFDTKREGVKKYTRAVRFDYEKEERKNISFTITPAAFQKGNYRLQLWHRGLMISEVYSGLK